jgi:hypothetical protein
MIQQQTFIIALMNMFTHNTKNTCLYATPDAERRGILLIKQYSDTTDLTLVGIPNYKIE